VTLWDGGSTLSLITFKFAKSLDLKGKPVKLEIIIVGGEAKAIESEIYRIVLIDNKNRKISMTAYCHHPTMSLLCTFLTALRLLVITPELEEWLNQNLVHLCRQHDLLLQL
jgi:hypothetical protein